LLQVHHQSQHLNMLVLFMSFKSCDKQTYSYSNIIICNIIFSWILLPMLFKVYDLFPNLITLIKYYLFLVFSLCLCDHASKNPLRSIVYVLFFQLHLYIMHNMLKVGYIFLDQNPGRALIRSTAIVIQLRAGDTLFVKIGNSNSKGTLLGSNFHTVFSGFLINWFFLSK
jgi:hypothetical protein